MTNNTRWLNGSRLAMLAVVVLSSCTTDPSDATYVSPPTDFVAASSGAGTCGAALPIAAITAPTRRQIPRTTQVRVQLAHQRAIFGGEHIGGYGRA